MEKMNDLKTFINLFINNYSKGTTFVFREFLRVLLSVIMTLYINKI